MIDVPLLLRIDLVVTVSALVFPAAGTTEIERGTEIEMTETGGGEADLPIGGDHLLPTVEGTTETETVSRLLLWRRSKRRTTEKKTGPKPRPIIIESYLSLVLSWIFVFRLSIRFLIQFGGLRYASPMIL